MRICRTVPALPALRPSRDAVLKGEPECCEEVDRSLAYGR